ncbi:NUDIX hydrolase [Streptomyces sp. NBC_01803]|uniref:NUDIX hydrolase n=1 Tax=Streptomyces sp. NBC_01803 TaxID=2975946 RepID=UPI002DDC8C79|nr:NUDIX hydrolase [Streptomyces sp. NBC_01803]WSA45483.1 NUDIX domain-containing protein [Streptomyces sp. NBC_01803]
MGSNGGRWFPADWPDRIRAFARGELAPVTPRPAATVMLLRDGAAGLEAYVLRRRASMAFAGGAYAYPGGAVDPRDVAAVGAGGAAVWAAVRETFEEAGVLLAGASPGEIVADVTGEDWEADRAALVARELSFTAFLARRGLTVRTDLLGPWARWITPEFEERRYDTWFFVAALPPGQRGRNASTEADRAAWLTPREAIDGYERGELLMLPPTIATLRELAPYDTAARALAAATAPAREATAALPVMARVTLVGNEVVVSWPGYEEFERRVAAADPAPNEGPAGSRARTRYHEGERES